MSPMANVLSNWPCVECQSSPDDPGPGCSCAHAPCLHDRNAEIARLRADLNLVEQEALRVLESARLVGDAPCSRDVVFHATRILDICLVRGDRAKLRARDRVVAERVRAACEEVCRAAGSSCRGDEVALAVAAIDLDALLDE